MINYKEILRLKALGFNNTRIAEVTGHARSTIILALKRAEAYGVEWSAVRNCSEQDVINRLHIGTTITKTYRMPDYENEHKQMQKSGVTLKLLWLEYCEECRANGEIPYQSTQFNKALD